MRFLEEDEDKNILLITKLILILRLAAERSIKTFCVGKKNWYFFDTPKGAGASAIIYSISETAKINNLSTYNYFCHLLTELPKLADEAGNIDPAALDPLLPWSKELPEKCYRSR